MKVLWIQWCVIAFVCFNCDLSLATGDDGYSISPIQLLSYCSANVAELCLQSVELPLSDEDIEDVVNCLNEFGNDELTPDCLNFIVTAKSGACNSDAQNLCTEYQRPREIVDCLRRHESQLSTACYENIYIDMEKKYEEEMARRELYYSQSTVFITVISIIYLLLPLVISYWAYKNSKAFSRLYLNTQHMEAYAALRTNPTSEANTTHSAEISFIGVSFWVEKKHRTPKSLFEARTKSIDGKSASSSSHKQILRSISGVFKAQTVTAIMGPTGGGKSTLLRLLGGRMNTGSFHGVRALNGSAMSPEHYDKTLSKQGFVAQFDTLFQELTVWQTMAYGAMLQMPTRLATLEKMVRAWSLMSELGLLEVANTKVGGDSNAASGGVERTEGVSGGQRRLLSIGLVLLSHPEVLFADEPTSGLDSANSLRVIELLHSISRSKHSTVVFSIHQPRPEAFALIDNLVLLSRDGQMVYSGPSGQAATFLSQFPGLEQSTLSSLYGQNPADFIIDILGLRSDKDMSPQPEQEGRDRERGAGSTASSLLSSASRDASIGPELAAHFRGSREHASLHRAIVSKLDIPNLKNSSTGSGARNGGDDDLITAEAAAMSSTSPTGFIQNAINDTLYGRSHRNYSVVNVEDEISYGTDANEDSNDIHTGVIAAVAKESSREKFSLHLWVLFARRVEILQPSNMATASFCAQIVAVAVLISIAFSYNVETTLEEPYQVVMVIFLLSSYAMMIQYLKIIPEYFVERKIIIMEIANGYIGCIAYICSALLTETPRAVVQTIALNGIVYLIRPLNPEFAQISFSFVCLTVGVSAWQSLLCLCCIVSDNINLAYTITFLTLGMGSLFGGLLVKLSNIPTMFRFVYHLSITAVTQRALIVNDLECCYLSVTCSSLLHDLHRAGVCPDDFQSGDKGNLGRWTLKDLELTDTPILSLLFLFLANVVCRGLAVAIMHSREKRKYQLKVKEVDAVEYAGSSTSTRRAVLGAPGPLPPSPPSAVEMTSFRP